MKVRDKSAPQSIILDANQRYTRLFSAKDGNALAFRSGHVSLKESESIGEHSTGESEEILIVLEGNGVLCIKGCRDMKMERNMAFYIPPNTVHDVKNSGRRLFRYIFVTSPIFASRGKCTGY